MYGQTLVEAVQGPGEVIFLPHGLTHSVLNLHDNVALTENFLSISSIGGKIFKHQPTIFHIINCQQINSLVTLNKCFFILELTKAVALDVISPFRPKWNQSRALDYLYYSGITNAKVR